MLISLDAVVVSILYNGIEEWIPSIGNVRLENGYVIYYYYYY